MFVNLTNQKPRIPAAVVIYLRRCVIGIGQKTLLIAYTCARHLGYYLAIKSQAQQLFGADYFLSHPLFPGGSFAV